MIRRSDASFTAPSGFLPDGDRDLLVQDGYWRNDGGGFFGQLVPAYTGRAHEAADVDGDGDMDLAGTRDLGPTTQVLLFAGAGGGFSALDLGTDARLRAALRPHTAAATVVIVAQRVSTIVDADQILVLEDGELVGRGTHEELLAGCTTYAEIVESQRSAEDAA